ncbi:MAG: aminomethyl-transferring glycine dehydrogenase subunit GcvPA [Clostridia bacterium]|jgi:glycine dehydrogenase subunit 1|nr:aminomethyl-transferring glycine dehydrogenase subunit GcvPA [Clostridia bacterium]
MNYVPHTEKDKREMLELIGVSSTEELFSDIPASLRLNQELQISGGLSEIELRRLLKNMAAKNISLDDYICFLGAGAYDHYIPSFIDQLLLRSEFYTAYTPYQPEISQGTLQDIYEYQTMICELTGMEVSNASMYDGASALAEATVMACEQTRRKEFVISEAVHPEYRETVKTYTEAQELVGKPVAFRDGVTAVEDVKAALGPQTAAVVVQYPNFFGNIEDLRALAELAHSQGALLVVAVADPVSLGILESPGACGADIVVGDGQSFGNPISFGGPHIGFFATREKYVRRMPGRIVGVTVDNRGQRAFVLTLQAREQHIRREKATSNICSNQALNALAVNMALSALGKSGLKEMAQQSLQKAHYAYQQLMGLPGVEAAFPGKPFFKEFVLKLPQDPEKVNEELLKHKIIGGLPLKRFYPELGNAMLFCVTEMRTKEEIDLLVDRMGGLK